MTPLQQFETVPKRDSATVYTSMAKSGPIKIYHSCDPADSQLLRRFKSGKYTPFHPLLDPQLSVMPVLIPKAYGKTQYAMRCAKTGCEVCTDTRDITDLMLEVAMSHEIRGVSLKPGVKATASVEARLADGERRGQWIYGDLRPSIQAKSRVQYYPSFMAQASSCQRVLQWMNAIPAQTEFASSQMRIAPLNPYTVEANVPGLQAESELGVGADWEDVLAERQAQRKPPSGPSVNTLKPWLDRDQSRALVHSQKQELVGVDWEDVLGKRQAHLRRPGGPSADSLKPRLVRDETGAFIHSRQQEPAAARAWAPPLLPNMQYPAPDSGPYDSAIEASFDPFARGEHKARFDRPCAPSLPTKADPMNFNFKYNYMPSRPAMAPAAVPSANGIDPYACFPSLPPRTGVYYSAWQNATPDLYHAPQGGPVQPQVIDLTGSDQPFDYMHAHARTQHLARIPSKEQNLNTPARFVASVAPREKRVLEDAGVVAQRKRVRYNF